MLMPPHSLDLSTLSRGPVDKAGFSADSLRLSRARSACYTKRVFIVPSPARLGAMIPMVANWIPLRV